MKAKLAAAVAVLMVAGTAAVSAETVTREVPAFSRIEVRGSTDIDVRAGANQLVVLLEGAPGVIERIVTEVSGETLVISGPRGSSMNIGGRGPRALIRVPQLQSITILGSGDARLSGIRSDTFSVSIAGSGDVVVAPAEGLSTVDRLQVDVAGSGDANLAALRARTAAVSVAGSGDVQVYTTEALDASVAGSGDVFYSGNPQRVNRKVAGSGTIVSR
ncbi:head GIN domain-containing protein [Gloeobacter violaceus]|uniref:Gll4023 protein n=1 Tax=Gloeobacter violaceus (strain ATCC 29082 / PCC 7421) TaxID=251221 RepID=Q7NE57_GLOVI|nr:head GIN domain-containing protein [Gloeobacter violaceus]BAC91964.1 gll4023 [Gloeobacter violaceus PCC 7421]